MTYTEFINNIINTRGQWATDLIYVQKHHIIPKCLGGQPKYVGKNCKHQNIIWLTPQEHYIAHELLALEHPDNLEITNAWWMMSHRKATKEFINKEVFEQLSIAYAQLLSKENTGEYNPFFGKKHSKQTLQKISQKNKGRSVSDETRLKLKQSLLGVHKGKVYIYNKQLKKTKAVFKSDLELYLANGWELGNGRKGKIISEQLRNKISENTKKGFQKWKQENPDEYKKFCEQVSQNNKGKKLSEESKQKISIANSGNKNGMYGTKSPSRKKVYCVELNKIFDCIADAEKETGCYHSHISACCKGKLKTVGGYHWRYIE